MKKLLIIVIMFSALRSSAMQRPPESNKGFGYELKLVKTLEEADVAKLEQLLKEGLEPNYIFQTGAYTGNPLFVTLLNVGSYDTNFIRQADLLVNKGVALPNLRSGLSKAAEHANPEVVRWFLKHGAMDEGNEILNLVEFRLKDLNTQAADKIKLEQIKKDLIEYKNKPQQSIKAPYVTTATESGAKQSELITALDQGNKTRIDELIKAGLDINKELGLFGFQGHTPLTLIAVGSFGYYSNDPKSNREEIARYLISKGAKPEQLNSDLLSAVRRGDVQQVKLLLALGAQDKDNASLDYATKEYNEYVAHNFDPQETANMNQIINLLKAKKGGPVKLTPKVKPMAAPAAAQVLLKPVAKPAAAQPQKVILKPTAKPIAKPVAAGALVAP